MFVFLGVSNESYVKKDGTEVNFHEAYFAETCANGFRPVLDTQRMSRADGSTFTRVNKGFYIKDGRLLDIFPPDWDKHVLQECDLRFNQYGRPVSVTFSSK